MSMILVLAGVIAATQAGGQAVPPAAAPIAPQASPPPVPALQPPVTIAPGIPLPPQDWSNLPVLRFRRPISNTADTTSFVQSEVTAGRCMGATRTPHGWALTVDLALLATAQGRVRRITPRAINCPTVEQFAAGLLLGTARDNVDPRGAAADTWYRTNMVFAWTG